MSTKDVIDMEVKELKEDEGMMLKVFKLEKFFHKNKTKIIAVLVLLFVGFIGYKINAYFVEQNLIKTNNAYAELMENPSNKKALAILKENQPLYQLYILHNAKDIKQLEALSNAQNPEIQSIAQYKIAMLKGDINSIKNYTLSTNALLRNAALYSLQRLYLQKGDIANAKKCYNEISDKSVYKQYSEALLHYGIVK